MTSQSLSNLRKAGRVLAAICGAASKYVLRQRVACRLSLSVDVAGAPGQSASTGADLSDSLFGRRFYLRENIETRLLDDIISSRPNSDQKYIGQHGEFQLSMLATFFGRLFATLHCMLVVRPILYGG